MPEFRKSMRGTRQFAVAAAALLLTAFYFAPATVFLFNASEVSVPLSTVVASSWPAQAFLLGTCALVALAGFAARRLAACLLLATATLLYLQGNVLVWDYGRFDGSDIAWARYTLRGVLELVLWLGVLAGSTFMRARIFGHVTRVTLVLLLLEAASLGASLADGRSFRPAAGSDLDADLFSFSSERNVLFIVLDAFQATAFEQLRMRDSSIDQRLDGFTYFDDATGVYPTTLMSIPAILSGKTFDNTRPIGEFMSEVLGADSLPALLSRHGFATHIVTKPSYCEYFKTSACIGQSAFLDAEPRSSQFRDCLQIWDVALFRHVPHFMKRRVYDRHAWLLQRTFAKSEVDGPAPAPATADGEEMMTPTSAQRASWAAWATLIADADGKSDRPTFKFVHLYTSHSPFVLDEDCQALSTKAYRNLPVNYRMVNQCACALSQLFSILDRLLELEVLDETLLIVAADHGSKTELLPRPLAKKRLPDLNRVLPLLLIKPVGARGALQNSHAQVSLTDLPRTVADALGLNANFPGIPLLAPPADTNRTRVFYDYTWEREAWDFDYLPRLQEYHIRGPAKVLASWETGREILAPE
jgi:hypothetical protein